MGVSAGRPAASFDKKYEQAIKFMYTTNKEKEKKSNTLPAPA
jgi:hypothetical protein